MKHATALRRRIAEKAEPGGQAPASFSERGNPRTSGTGDNYDDSTLLAEACQADLQEFGRLVSLERLNRFMASANDLATGVVLYIRNARLFSRLFEIIGYFEVGMRNHINEALVAQYGADWMGNLCLFDNYSMQRLRTASSISDLAFGFWNHIFSNVNDKTLWRVVQPTLDNVKLSERRQLYKALTHIRELRNRIAHHEPIVFGIRIKKEAKIYSTDEIMEDMKFAAQKISPLLYAIVEKMSHTLLEQTVVNRTVPLNLSASSLSETGTLAFLDSVRADWGDWQRENCLEQLEAMVPEDTVRVAHELLSPPEN